MPEAKFRRNNVTIEAPIAIVEMLDNGKIQYQVFEDREPLPLDVEGMAIAYGEILSNLADVMSNSCRGTYKISDVRNMITFSMFEADRYKEKKRKRAKKARAKKT